jgi:hypothetical protein
MLPAEAGASADLRRGAEALKSFKKKVDAVLDSFESSPGNAKHVANQTISRGAFSGSGSFGEAEDLYLQYHTVHERLTTLSKSLADQIEAMGIAVHGADVGFDNLDEDLRHRFWQLQAKIREDNKPPEDTHEKPQKRTDDRQTGAGY